MPLTTAPPFCFFLPCLYNQMREHADDVNYDVADRYERELRHDVMSHIEAFGEQVGEWQNGCQPCARVSRSVIARGSGRHFGWRRLRGSS